MSLVGHTSKIYYPQIANKNRMERIVQLTDYEYKRLKEQAEATQATIEEGIREGVKHACN